jgi:hypothetical protein
MFAINMIKDTVPSECGELVRVSIILCSRFLPNRIVNPTSQNLRTVVLCI